MSESWHRQNSKRDAVSLFLSEIIGTALLVFIGCMGCLPWGQSNNNFTSSVTFGLAVLMVVQIFGCVSGAFINPSVTVAAMVYNVISIKMGFLYIVAQVAGAFMGYGVLILLIPEHLIPKGLCTTVPHPDVTVIQALFIEFICTSILIFFCCAVWDPRNEHCSDSIPIRFGLAIGGLGIAAGNLTGCSMNPARSFGPVAWNGGYYLHWIYWVGPLSAALVTSLVYKNVFRRELNGVQYEKQVA